MKKKLYHSYIYITGSLIQALVPFLILPILAKFLSQSEFGVLMVLISIGTVLSFGFSLGIPAVLSRELIFSKKKASFFKEIAQSFQSLLLLISFLFYIFSIIFSHFLNLKIILLSISLALTLTIIQIDLSILRAEFKSVKFTSLSILSTTLPILVVTFFSIAKLNYIYFTYVASSLVICLIINFKYYKKIPNIRTILETKKMINLGFPMIFHGISISLFQYGDKIASFIGLGSELAAEVAFVSLFMTAPMLLLNTINNAWSPSTLELFNNNSSKAYAYLSNTSKKLSILITFICIIIVILAKPLVSTFIPSDYSQANISIAIIIGVSFTPLYLFYLQNTHILMKLKKFSSLAKITPISASVQFIFTFGLVNYIGVSAPAFGLLLAIILQVVLTSISTKVFKKFNIFPLYSTLLLILFNIIFLNFFF